MGCDIVGSYWGMPLFVDFEVVVDGNAITVVGGAARKKLMSSRSRSRLSWSCGRCCRRAAGAAARTTLCIGRGEDEGTMEKTKAAATRYPASPCDHNRSGVAGSSQILLFPETISAPETSCGQSRFELLASLLADCMAYIGCPTRLRWWFSPILRKMSLLLPGRRGCCRHRLKMVQLDSSRRRYDFGQLRSGDRRSPEKTPDGNPGRVDRGDGEPN
ncbi:hypothetical protein ACLOJK_007042 [Asimina triloba]